MAVTETWRELQFLVIRAYSTCEMHMDTAHRNGDTLLKKQCQSNYRKLIRVGACEMPSCGDEFRKNSNLRNRRTVNMIRYEAAKHQEFPNSWSDANENVASLHAKQNANAISMEWYFHRMV